jgi:hypothetical protein
MIDEEDFVRSASQLCSSASRTALAGAHAKQNFKHRPPSTAVDANGCRWRPLDGRLGWRVISIVQQHLIAE